MWIRKKVVDYFNKGGGDISEFGLIMDSSTQYGSHLTNSYVEFIEGKRMKLSMN
jgi:hypothetical protein